MSFVMTSTQMRVTDPCYTKDTRCAGVLENVLTGKWITEQIYTDDRVKELQIWHESYAGVYPEENSDLEIGVDSGQAGFFDEKFYPDDIGQYDDLESFYGKICESTLEDGAGVDFGVASSSGYGDGSYECFVGRNQAGQIVSASIIFITDENDAEEDEDDFYEDEDEDN